MRLSHPRRPNATLVALAAAATLGGADLAVAQTPAGSQGRALDANPQQGSGGLNRPERVIDFNARNDLVTGNVTDFRSFRGDVPFGAPSDFRAALGSDDLFTFRADSFASGLTQLNAADVGRGGNNVTTRVFGTAAQIPSFDFNQRPLDNRRIAPLGGGFQVFNPVFSPPSAVTGVITATRPPNLRDSGNTVGLVTIPDGRTLEVTASPLLGLRRSELPTAPRTLEELDQQEEDATRLELELRDELEFGARSRFGERLEPIALTEEEIAEFGPFAAQSGRIEPTQLLGRVVQSRLLTNRGDVPASETIEDRVERIENAIFRPLGNRNVEPGQDVYLDLLQQLRESQTTGEPRPRQAPLAPREDDDAATDDSVQGLFDPTRLEPLQPELGDALEEPSRQELDDALARAIEARLRALGVRPVEEIEAEDNAAGDGSDATGNDMSVVEDPVAALLERMREDELDNDPTAATVARLLGTLAADTAPVSTLAGERETRLNQLMRQAETELAAGRFFVAEGLYRQIVDTSERPQPLARVGQVNAQLAAGMIRSAGINLRSLFVDHPELIGVRYEANLLPPRDRLSFLQNELRRTIAQTPEDPDAGLLLGYLGFQAGSERLVRYGLAVAEAAAPRDAVLPVVRGVWLERIDAPRTATGDIEVDAGGDATADPSSDPPMDGVAK